MEGNTHNALSLKKAPLESHRHKAFKKATFTITGNREGRVPVSGHKSRSSPLTTQTVLMGGRPLQPR